ncbi:TPA: hypothetical protein ACH6H0_001605 [Campylobacter jejuni]
MQNIMKELGKNIIKNINYYQIPKKLDFINDNPKFVIYTPKDLKLISGNLKERQRKNSMYNETTYKIDENTKLQFPSSCNKYNLIAIHTWNHYGNAGLNFIDSLLNYSSLKFSNKKISLSKENNFLSSVVEFHNSFILDEESYIVYNQDNNVDIAEYFYAVYSWKHNSIRAKHCNIISFLLASPEGNYHTEEIDFEALANQNIEIPKEYNFNHLIPPMELYKEIIDEYCARMDPRKLAPLQNQIKEKDNIISTLNQEKTTLKNELSSIPTKKQRLELANLEQNSIIKKLENKKLAKSLGIKMSIINPKITFIQANSAKARIQIIYPIN